MMIAVWFLPMLLLGLLMSALFATIAFVAQMFFMAAWVFNGSAVAGVFKAVIAVVIGTPIICLTTTLLLAYQLVMMPSMVIDNIKEFERGRK